MHLSSKNKPPTFVLQKENTHSCTVVELTHTHTHMELFFYNGFMSAYNGCRRTVPFIPISSSPVPVQTTARNKGWKTTQGRQTHQSGHETYTHTHTCTRRQIASYTRWRHIGDLNLNIHRLE